MSSLSSNQPNKMSSQTRSTNLKPSYSHILAKLECDNTQELFDEVWGDLDNHLDSIIIKFNDVAKQTVNSVFGSNGLSRISNVSDVSCYAEDIEWDEDDNVDMVSNIVKCFNPSIIEDLEDVKRVWKVLEAITSYHDDWDELTPIADGWVGWGVMYMLMTTQIDSNLDVVIEPYPCNDRLMMTLIEM